MLFVKLTLLLFPFQSARLVSFSCSIALARNSSSTLNRSSCCQHQREYVQSFIIKISNVGFPADALYEANKVPFILSLFTKVGRFNPEEDFIIFSHPFYSRVSSVFSIQAAHCTLFSSFMKVGETTSFAIKSIIFLQGIKLHFISQLPQLHGHITKYYQWNDGKNGCYFQAQT